MSPETFARRAALVALAVVAVTTTAPTLGAQQPRGAAAPRAEQRLRQRVAAIVREQLGLDEAQVRQLRETSARYEGERRQLALRDRELRQQLRDELQGGASANQDRVSRALDRMLEVQRTRVDIVEREQRDLAKFLTPVQRAKYLVLQDQLRRRLEEFRREREAGAVPGPGRLRRQGALAPRDTP